MGLSSELTEFDLAGFFSITLNISEEWNALPFF